MKQVICSSQSGVVWAKVRARIYAFGGWVLHAASPRQPGVACERLRRSARGAGYFFLPHPQDSGRCCQRPDFPVSNVTRRSPQRILAIGSHDFWRHVTSSLHGVTMALHARNAKKNLGRGNCVESSVVYAFACNAGQHPSIFRENTSVSYAADSPIDRMMNRNSIPDFPYRQTLTGMLTRNVTRGQSALFCRAGNGDAS
ncbi:hypothetical protein D9X30_0582 [Cupriavidus sp. U2]|nr:hypothetical protein D9X30_0582 [Cupriavidus sp. U2]